MDAPLKEIRRRIRLLARRAVLTVVDPDRKTQSIQAVALADEVIDEFEHMEPYGLTSHPHPGAEVIVASLGGASEHSVAVIVGDKRYRARGLEEGEVCLYTDEDFLDTGQPGAIYRPQQNAPAFVSDHDPDKAHRITMKRGRIIEMRCGLTTLTLEPDGMTLVTPGGTQRWNT